jgi:4,5-dihydroxyphthalate decarboxylase
MKSILKTALRRSPEVASLFTGQVAAKRHRFAFESIEPITKAFPRMARDLEFDVSEMALVTLALARDFEKAVLGLPVVLSGGFHHGSLLCLEDSPLRGPEELRGRKVAVRAFAQTTGVWVRGLLQHTYGVRTDEVTWIVSEGSHVQEYVDPPNVLRETNKSLIAMLEDGEVDAFIGVAPPGGPRLRTVIANAPEAAAAWHERTRVLPVNHVLSLKQSLLEQTPELGRELVEAFDKARPASSALHFTREALRLSVETCLAYSKEQGILRHDLHHEDLFAGI